MELEKTKSKKGSELKMAEHCGYIVKITELNKHPNAHSLQIATIFGASVIVDLNVKINDIGIYFPTDL